MSEINKITFQERILTLASFKQVEIHTLTHKKKEIYLFSDDFKAKTNRFVQS